MHKFSPMARDYKWYVVWVGVEPGVYDSWEECKLQTTNYPGARYKSFNNKEDAVAAYRGNPAEQMGILRAIANQETNRQVNYAAFPDIIVDSIAVDASCLGNPGVMEYQGVSVSTGEVLFRKGPYRGGTNNIGEFIGIVHALAALKKQGKDTTIYSDSVTAISWVRKRACLTKLARTPENAQVFGILERAIDWIRNNEYPNRILKWNTKEWGEIPADFGRK